MNERSMFHLLRDAAAAWSADKVPQLGAALAYYAVFSLAPLLLIVVAIAGMVFEEAAARQGILREIEAALGDSAARSIGEVLENSRWAEHSRLAALIGLGVALFGASGVFVQLQDALNTIWKVPPPPGRGLVGLVRGRFLSFGIVLATGFLLLASLVASAGLTAAARLIDPAAIPGGVWIWQLLNNALSFALVTLLFALIYKVLPDAPVAWRDVWLGAVVTAALFSLGKHLIGLYLGRGGVSSAFGAAGSIVVLLAWVYYSAQIMLFGAELTHVWSQRRAAGA